MCLCLFDALLETRVKKKSVESIRRKIGDLMYVDNYDQHGNGRIWFLWVKKCIDYRFSMSTWQFIHGNLYKLDGTYICWITAIYAFSQLELRKLWEDILQLAGVCNGCWCAI